MDLTDAYENGAYIPDAASYPPRWAAEAEAFRAQLGERARLDLPYGSDARQRFDLFLPAGEAAGLMIFIHGGYWLKFDKSQWSHLAAGAILRGWAVAMPSYRLAPDVRIADITRDVAASVEAASAEVDGPVVVTGHSAGGHLTARMACLELAASNRIKRYVPISPLSDLRPLMQTSMNAQLRIDSTEVEAESPVFATTEADVTVWVGAEERPAFLDQARWLSEAWDCPLRIAPGRHHFDVIEEMTQAHSPLIGALLDGL